MEAITILSIVSTVLLPVYPPAKTAVVVLDAAPTHSFATLKFPKSTALPAEAIVTYAITSVTLGDALFPPPITPLVELQAPAGKSVACVKFPKSVALPLEEIDIS